MAEKRPEKRLLRNYDLRASTHNWLKNKAKAEGRTTIRQLETIIEEARAADEATAGQE
jgi:hypothetical protein